jgi:hypothetical protein
MNRSGSYRGWGLGSIEDKIELFSSTIFPLCPIFPNSPVIQVLFVLE